MHAREIVLLVNSPTTNQYQVMHALYDKDLGHARHLKMVFLLSTTNHDRFFLFLLMAPPFGFSRFYYVRKRERDFGVDSYRLLLAYNILSYCVGFNPKWSQVMQSEG